MNKKWITIERVVAIFACIFLILSIISLHFSDTMRSAIPHSTTILLVVHTISFFLALYCVFKPNFSIEITILQVESIFTILTGLAPLGIFLFYGSVFIFFCKKSSTKNTKTKLLIALIIHILVIFATFVQGLLYTFMTLICSFFYCAFFIWIYFILKTRFSIFTPTKVIENSTIVEKLPGTKINLSDYNLTERQKQFTIENIKNNLSYNEISDKYNVSISLVKKEFRAIFQIFGVSKKEELRLLLLQYEIDF